MSQKMKGVVRGNTDYGSAKNEGKNVYLLLQHNRHNQAAEQAAAYTQQGQENCGD